MATTTNYSWTTPDDTDLVKDGASAIRTLGSSADTTVKNLNPGTIAGDIDYYTSSTAKARIGIGTAGQILKVNSGATAPEWATIPTGKVLQVVSAFKDDTFSTSSNSYVDITGLSVSITPTLATSKIYIMASVQGLASTGGPGAIRLMRDSTSIGNAAAAGNRTIGFASLTRSGGQTDVSSASTNFLDSPATTSATTYKIQAIATASPNVSYINRGGADDDLISRIRCSSSITVMEIAV